MARLILGWPTLGSNAPEPRKPLYLADRFSDRARGRSDVRGTLAYEGDGHLMTIAPTGAGKGRGVIIPTLLTYPGSVIVIDPKGENFLVTARRRMEMGQDVFVLDPFERVTPRSIAGTHFRGDSLNPLDTILYKNPVEDADAQMIATLLSTKKEGGAKDPFWDETGIDLLAGIIHDVATREDSDDADRTIEEVINFLYSADFEERIVERAESQDVSGFAQRAFDAYRSVFARETRTSILTTSRSYLNSLSGIGVRRALGASSIKFSEIQGDGSFTIYIVIPPDKLVSHRALLRAWVGVLLTAIQSRRAKPKYRTLFLLDECAQLGSLDELRSAVTLLRGYGLQVWMFFQDFAQLEQLYPDYATLVHNCGVLQVFGASRASQAKPLAPLLATGEQLAPSASSGDTPSRDSYMIDLERELISLGLGFQAVAMNGELEFPAMLDYLEHRAFAGLWDENPMFKGKKP